MTKREYKREQERLNKELTAVEAKLEAYQKAYDETGEVKEDWNDIEDQKWEINQEIKDLDRAWNTRKWTAADWNTHELVMNNID